MSQSEVSDSTPRGGQNENLEKFFTLLTDIVKDADYDDMWGVGLRSEKSHVPTQIVLQKFLNANNDNLEAAKKQLLEALRWRKKVNPRKLMEEVLDEAKFGGLGYVTEYEVSTRRDHTDTTKEIVSWNIYGAVKDVKATFGDIEEFIRWRTALMELSLQPLNLPNAVEVLPARSPQSDPYKITQVHDYLSVSFLRMDPQIRAASKEIINVFSMAYPELLKEKFFVNVPVIMGWVFGVIKLFVAKETIKKFHPLSYGASLAGEMKECGEHLPKAYGGKGKDLEEIGAVVKTEKKGGTGQ